MSKTLRDVIKELQGLPEKVLDYTVVMSKDGEGNDYSPFSGIGWGIYTPETTWYGEFTPWKYEDDENQTGEETELSLEESNAIVLWPVN